MNLDDDERALVSAFRAFRAYVRERTRLDPTIEKPPPDDELWLELHPDGSGFLIIDPEDPNAPTFRETAFHELAKAAPAIDQAREVLEAPRRQREAAGGRRFGDPRRGRRRA